MMSSGEKNMWVPRTWLRGVELRRPLIPVEGAARILVSFGY
ncbi:hypothetical protein HMPREF1861_01923 [Corynebacterium kroppenstedtii]|nr:hypothetical protein HMPREF1861_01923 [Corynebacterium kroppenstedtii]